MVKLRHITISIWFMCSWSKQLINELPVFFFFFFFKQKMLASLVINIMKTECQATTFHPGKTVYGFKRWIRHPLTGCKVASEDASEQLLILGPCWGIIGCPATYLSTLARVKAWTFISCYCAWILLVGTWWVLIFF